MGNGGGQAGWKVTLKFLNALGTKCCSVVQCTKVKAKHAELLRLSLPANTALAQAFRLQCSCYPDVPVGQYSRCKVLSSLCKDIQKINILTSRSAPSVTEIFFQLLKTSKCARKLRTSEVTLNFLKA